MKTYKVIFGDHGWSSYNEYTSLIEAKKAYEKIKDSFEYGKIVEITKKMFKKEEIKVLESFLK